ncbi:MAG: hypothetical protein OJF50_001430 [Nitrospira sp.]|nr:hypothetical protein [Nitrospira sp.]
MLLAFQFPLHREGRFNARTDGHDPRDVGFQFPLHREGRFNGKLGQASLKYDAFQFPLHREGRFNLLAGCEDTCKCRLSVPSS